MATDTVDIDRVLTNSALLGAGLGDPKTWWMWLLILERRSDCR